jgi:hypothetical protein
MSCNAEAAGTQGSCSGPIIANDEQPVTAHDIAMATADDSLPARVRAANQRRAASIGNRATDYQRWRAAADTLATAMREARERDVGLRRSIDHGRDYLINGGSGGFHQ